MSEIKSNRAWREECESLRQQLSSRDAEVAELKNQLADNNLFDSDRNQWRNTYRRTISDLTKERDQLREQVKLLRHELDVISKCVTSDDCRLIAVNALAATE